MYFTLSKLLPSLIMPYSVLFYLLILALVLVYKKNFLALKRLLWITILVFYGLSLPILSTWHSEDDFKQWENYTLPSDTTDAVVVLGGFMVPDSIFNYGVEAPFDRLLAGIRMYKSGKARFLVLSGGVAEGEIRKPEAEYMHLFIKEFTSVPDSVIILEKQSTTTYENAIFTKYIFEKRNLSMRIYLVSSASHLDRATELFTNEGFEVIPIPVDLPYSTNLGRSFPFNFIPSSHSLIYWSKVYRERLGYYFYKIYNLF